MSDPKILGFLTVMEYDRVGLIGGLLMLNEMGRPRWFHCTAPVRVLRAQEILYGNSLPPFLYGEQIAQTLLTQASEVPQFIFTDLQPVLAVADFVKFPIVYVSSQTTPATTSVETVPVVEQSLQSFGIARETQSAENTQDAETIDAAATWIFGRWHKAMIGRRVVMVPARDALEAKSLAEKISADTTHVDLVEPFTRLRLAINETQKEAA